MDLDDEELQEAIEMWDSRGYVYAVCDTCKEEVQVEPDAEYTCPECGEGTVTSPLRKAGLI